MRIVNNVTAADPSPPNISKESLRSLMNGVFMRDLIESQEETKARLSQMVESLKQQMLREARVRKLHWIEETVAESVSLAAKSALLVYSMGDEGSYVSFLEHRPAIAMEIAEMHVFPFDNDDLRNAKDIAHSISAAYAARRAIADIEAELGL